MLLDTLKALADPTRLRLVALLAQAELTVQELTAIMAMGQSRISRHLKILAEAGILNVKRQGTWGYYRLGEDSAFFREIWPALESRLGSLPERPCDLGGLARSLEARRKRSQDFFEHHARNWDELSQQILPVPEYRKLLLGMVPSCRALVEVGIGTGVMLSGLAGKAERMVGVDHSSAMLGEARKRVTGEGMQNVELRLGEMSHLPVSDGWADVVLLDMVFHHAAQPAEVLKELSRVLAARGQLVIADLQRHEQEWVRERMADQWLGFAAKELESWLTSAGFALRQYRSIPGSGGSQGVFLMCAQKAAAAATGDSGLAAV